MKRAILTVVLFLGLAGVARANDCSGTACTITSSSLVALSIPGGSTYIVIDNESASASIACAFANGTAALNTAGSYTLAPGVTRVWQLGSQGGGVLPPGNLNCISSAATSPATIEVH